MRRTIVFLLVLAAVGCEGQRTYTSEYSGVVPAGVEYHQGTIWVAAAHLKLEPNAEYVPALYAFTPTRSIEPKHVREYSFTRTRWRETVPQVLAGMEFSDDATLPTLWATDASGNLARFRPNGGQSFFYFAELATRVDAIEIVPLTSSRRWIFLFSREPGKAGVRSTLIDLEDGDLTPGRPLSGAFGGGCGEWGYCWLVSEVGSGVKIDAVGVAETLDLARTEFSISSLGAVRSEICQGADGLSYFVAGEELISFNFSTHDVVRSKERGLTQLPADVFLSCGPAASNGHVWAGVSGEPAVYQTVELSKGTKFIDINDATLTRFVVATEEAYFLIDGRMTGNAAVHESCGGKRCEVTSTKELGLAVEKVAP